MTTVELVDLLHHAHGGDPWHGSSLTAILSDVDAEGAARRSVPGRHTIWEIVRHLCAWTGEVDRRIGGALAGDPPEGDWPAVTTTSQAAWTASLQALAHAHRALEATVTAQPDTKWQERVGDIRNPSAGTGVTYGVMVIGLATHYAYHGGQIALMK